MIQHLKIDSPPAIKSQKLLNLGKVNIITGRNSGGKSTILKTILQKPDLGITYKNSPEVLQIMKELFINHSRPSQEDLEDWNKVVISTLKGQILFSTSREETLNIIRSAKENSRVRNINVNEQAQQIAYRILPPGPPGLAVNQILLLSPKRRMQYEMPVDTNNNLDPEAFNLLSRLFYLQNDIPESEERNKFEKIQANFRDITGYEFVVRLRLNQDLPKIQLHLRRIGGTWLFGQNEGLGLAEILTIITYSLDGAYTLLLIEEPENHIHPDLQRKLLLFLNSVEDKQFILSTHSPVFLNPTMVDRIFFCKYDNGEIKIDDNTSRANALSDIGVLAIDNLTSDAIVITEGKTDQIILNHIIMKWLEAPANSSISHVFLSGSMMMYFDPKPFSEISNLFTLLDLDTGNESAQKKFIKACEAEGINPIQLKRYCIESYYTLSAIRQVFGDIVPAEIKSLDESIPPWKQLADDKHDENWWKGELKSARRIPTILDNMTLSDIEGTDLLDFCNKIKLTL